MQSWHPCIDDLDVRRRRAPANFIFLCGELDNVDCTLADSGLNDGAIMVTGKNLFDVHSWPTFSHSG